ERPGLGAALRPIDPGARSLPASARIAAPPRPDGQRTGPHVERRSCPGGGRPSSHLPRPAATAGPGPVGPRSAQGRGKAALAGESPDVRPWDIQTKLFMLINYLKKRATIPWRT